MITSPYPKECSKFLRQWKVEENLYASCYHLPKGLTLDLWLDYLKWKGYYVDLEFQEIKLLKDGVDIGKPRNTKTDSAIRSVKF